MSTPTRPSKEEIDSKVQRSLDGTPYATSSLQTLDGGSVNWIYRAPLLKPLEDGTTEVTIKHGETWVASRPDFELNFVRSHTEAVCLETQHGAPAHVAASLDPKSQFPITIRTPKLHHYDAENANQFQEYLPNSIDFKNFILDHYPPETPEKFKPQCRELGKALGRWRWSFRDWAAQKPELVKAVKENSDARMIRHMVHFEFILKRVGELPHILKEAEDVFTQVVKMAAAEGEDESKLGVCHGDFWTGNMILPNQPLQPNVPVPVLVIDWEMAQLNHIAVDLGEMIAEFWALQLYKRITAGIWILEGFVEGLGEISEDLAFRTAIQVGAHVLAVTGEFEGVWGDKQKIEEVAAIARDVIVNAWNRNRSYFEEGGLGCLFRKSAKP